MAGTKIVSKADGTPVTDLDNYSLARLRELIAARFPDDFTIGEEDKRNETQIQEILNRQDQYQWTIDGLDGTGNYRMRLNSYGASVSRRRGNEILFAAIFRPVDEALRGDGFFYAEHGKGAWQFCNDCHIYHKLRTAAPGELERITVMPEGSSKKFPDTPLPDLQRVITARPSFSSCIAATTVAMGLASALITVENEPWDNWPSVLMIKEASGIVTDWQGNPITPENCGSIVAAGNETDHAQIVELLNQ